MTLSEFEEFDFVVMSDVREILARMRSRIEDAGLTSGVPELEVWNREPGSYTSEVRVYFWREGDLEDALEFHVFEDGRQIVTQAEVQEWFQTQLEEIIAGRSRGDQP